MMECKHENLIIDQFAKLVGVSRSVPGNAYCLDCKEPVPIEIKEEDQ